MSGNPETPNSAAATGTTVQSGNSTQTDTVPAHKDKVSGQPPEPPGAIVTLSIIFVGALLIAIGYGIHLRRVHEEKLTRITAESSIMTLAVARPTLGSPDDELVLPGNVQAFTDTPIYARTDGYLKEWYFDIGSHVHKGDLLAVIEAPEVDQQLNQSRAELERIQANEQLAGVTSNRWQALLAKHAVSQQEADQTKSNYIAAQAAVDASRANVHRLEQLQGYERIVAPFDGVITARNTDIGDLIQAGSSSTNPRELFHMDATGVLRVYASVPEVDSDAVHDGDMVFLSEDANPNLRIEGKVVRNSNAINDTTRTLNVEVDIDNTKGLLRPGAYVFVHFHMPSNPATVTIPSNALLFREEGLRVGVMRGNQVELVPVTVGHDYGNSVEVVAGLTAQDEVVLDPPDSLVSGTEVRPRLAARGKS
jgi:RND family efflux transporter MFP subunit